MSTVKVLFRLADKSDSDGFVRYRISIDRQFLTIRSTHSLRLSQWQELNLQALGDTARQRSCYRNASYKINYHLRRLAESLHIGFPLTLYCARHSWASAARTNGVPLSVISEGMGHSSESMTRIYLASLDTSTVDRANRMIIRSLAK